MLDSFFVENFRLFRRLEMARLGQVNLLVGKNNSGKSALLEAIELYASNASIRTLLSLILGREEEWNERNQSGNQQNKKSCIVCDVEKKEDCHDDVVVDPTATMDSTVTTNSTPTIILFTLAFMKLYKNVVVF